MSATLLERLVRTLKPVTLGAGLIASLSLSTPAPMRDVSLPTPEPPAPRWSFTADEARRHFASVRDTTYRVPAWRSRKMTGEPFYVLHMTGEGSCESNRDFLRGIRGRRRIPPLAHVLVCEDGRWYDLAERDRITTGLGRGSSLRGDTLVREQVYNIEVQGTPWESITEEQKATLEAFFTIEDAEGRYADSLVYSHMLLASERLPGIDLRMTGRKPDGANILVALGIPLRYAEDVSLFPLHLNLFALERRGELTQESFNEAFGFLGRIDGRLAWRVPARQSAYPLLAGEFSSAAALYYFPASGELVSGADLYTRAGRRYDDLFALPSEAIVLLGPRNSRERAEAIPRLLSSLEFEYGQNAFASILGKSFTNYELNSLHPRNPVSTSNGSFD